MEYRQVKCNSRKKDQPLVSIALATFNGGQFLAEQIESILSQTYANIDIVIIDDASTDETPSIIRSFTESHPGLVSAHFNPRNLGLVKNFEKAIENCTGDFIALSDQDDIWEPNKIDRLMMAIKDKSLVFSDLSLIDTNGTPIFGAKNGRLSGHGLGSIGFNDLIFRNHITGCTVLFRKDIVTDVIPIPEHAIFHDWWIAIVASKRAGIAYVDECLVKYRQHSRNVYGYRSRHAWAYIRSILIRDKKTVADYKSRSRRIRSMIKHRIFSDEDRIKLTEAILFYDSYTLPRNLLLHWLLLFKNFPNIKTSPWQAKLHNRLAHRKRRNSCRREKN